MSSNKTQPTASSPDAFIDAIEDPRRREEVRFVDRLMREVTGESPQMWGPSIVGYGNYHYRYASGREGDWMLIGFSPRKAALTLYIMAGFQRWDELMARLGKYTTGKSCLYIKRLADIDLDVLRELASLSVAHMRTHPPDGGCAPI